MRKLQASKGWCLDTSGVMATDSAEQVELFLSSYSRGARGKNSFVKLCPDPGCAEFKSSNF